MAEKIQKEINIITTQIVTSQEGPEKKVEQGIFHALSIVKKISKEKDLTKQRK